MEDMTNIEMYSIQMSLNEGTVRDVFPNLVGILNRFAHRKELTAAMDDYVKAVAKKKKGRDNRNLAFDIAKRYGGIDWRDLVSVIDTAVNKGIIGQQFSTV